MSARVTFGTLNGGGRHTLDAPVAAFAGLSVAFLAFAIPGDLLAQLVGATGLDNFISAAAPPLGAKARIGIGGAGAVAVFTVAFLALRWLDRIGSKPRRLKEESVLDLEPPRLRRRDVHPDAPARAPLLATYDLGEPEATDMPVVAAPELPAVVASPAPEPPAVPPLADTVLPAEPSFGREPGPGFGREPEAGFGREPEPELDISPPPAVEDEEVAPSLELSAEGHSIADLMARLEQGLARRRTHVAPADPMVAEPAPEPTDERLQSAIENLQRLASRQP